MTRGWSKNADGDVVITMSPDDYSLLLFSLGEATGARVKQRIFDVLGLMNRMNAGNPMYTPYEEEQCAACQSPHRSNVIHTCGRG